MKISVTVGLDDVKYEGSESTIAIKDKLVASLKKNLGKIIFASSEKEEDVDLIRLGNRYGFAFAFSKFDNNFRSDEDGGFRYRTREVKRALTKVVEEFDLDPQVKYDRGFGVFVYNIFEKAK